MSGFATLGGHKKSLRDYARWIQKLTPQLKCKSIPLRLKNVGKHGTCERPHLVLCPHNVIAVAHDNLPEDVFARLFLGAPGEIHEYWDKQKNEKWVAEHPGFLQEKAPTFDEAVPLYVHADWGQHINEDKVLVQSWGGCLSWEPTSVALFLFTVLPFSCCIPGVSDTTLHKVLNWSFDALCAGEHPWRDWDGSEFQEGSDEWLLRGHRIAGKYHGLFSHYRGDWEWQLEAFKWRGYRHNLVCHLDFACKLPGLLCFTDWDGFWKGTNLSHETYIDETLVLPVAAEIKGWRLERTKIDTMHAVNLGVCHYFIASILYELAHFRVNLLLGPVGRSLLAAMD